MQLQCKNGVRRSQYNTHKSVRSASDVQYVMLHLLSSARAGVVRAQRGPQANRSVHFADQTLSLLHVQEDKYLVHFHHCLTGAHTIVFDMRPLYSRPL